MTTSPLKDDLRDRSTDIVPKKSNNNLILKQLKEVKKKKKHDCSQAQLERQNKREDLCNDSKRQYPSNTTVIVGDSIINGIREERLSGINGVVKVCNFPGATI